MNLLFVKDSLFRRQSIGSFPLCVKKRKRLHIFIGVEALITTFWVRVFFSASSDNLVQALDQLIELLGRQHFDQVADPVHRERTDLADLDPRAFRQVA